MYDQYSGLYYLQSRYYNPTYGRFINADSIMKIGNVLGANVFAYCNNNPVNFADYDGRDAKTIIKNVLLLFVAVGMITADLGDSYNYLFENVESIDFSVTTTNDITDFIITIIHNSDEDNYESYDIKIKIAAIDTWMLYLIQDEHVSNETYVAEFWVELILFALGFVPVIGTIFSVAMQIACVQVFIEFGYARKFNDFLFTKIENAVENNEQYISFVESITKYSYNFWGELKGEIIYCCV